MSCRTPSSNQCAGRRWSLSRPLRVRYQPVVRCAGLDLGRGADGAGDEASDASRQGRRHIPKPAAIQETPASPEQEQQDPKPAPASPAGETRSAPHREVLSSDGQGGRLPTSARILAAAAVGVALILLIVAIVTNMQTDAPPSATSTDGQGANESSGGIAFDSTLDTSPDEIRLTQLKAVQQRSSLGGRYGNGQLFIDKRRR